MSPFLLRRLSDELLGSRLAHGEAAAFDELYRRYVNRLAAYGAHLLGDAAAGDDVAQSTLLKAYGALRDGQVPERMKPWLFRVAHNTAIDLVKRRRELPSANLPERPSAAGEPRAGALVAALAGLPDRQRRVYVLRELHGLRIDETAQELSLTATQVEQALFAARNRLAEVLTFGDRLDCVAVRRLAAGPLDTDERRALKTHLRSCPACRSEVALPARVALFPDWLRGLLTGGGAPVAAKLGAVVASATVATGVPITVERTNHRELPPRHVVPAKLVVQRAAPVHAAAAVALVRPAVPPHEAERHHAVEAPDRRERRSSEDRRDGGGEAKTTSTTSLPAGAAPTPVTTTATDGESPPPGPTTTTTTVGDTSHDGGGTTTMTTTTTSDGGGGGDGIDGGSGGLDGDGHSG